MSNMTSKETSFERSAKQIPKEYKDRIDWTHVEAVTLEEKTYESSSEYDALNRPTKRHCSPRWHHEEKRILSIL